MNNEALETKEYQAINLLDKGQKLMNPSFINGLFSSKNSRFNEAFNYFTQAGQLYKLALKFSEAAYCYEQCVLAKEKMKENELDSLKEVLFCYHKANDSENYMRVFDKTMVLFTIKGEYSEAGNMCWKSAEKAEKEDDVKAAIILYAKAVEFFGMDKGNQTTKIHLCLLKKAELMCLSNDSKAEDSKSIFEKVAIGYMKSPLSISASVELFIKAVICSIAYEDNTEDAKARIAKYKTMNEAIEDTGLDMLIRNTIAGIDSGDVLKIKNAFNKFREVNSIDNWYLHMFTLILGKIDTVIHNKDEVINDFT